MAERADCAPASNRETTVTQTCPIGIARDSTRVGVPLKRGPIALTPVTAQAARYMRRSGATASIRGKGDVACGDKRVILLQVGA